nr:MAG TPA: hypothetical protein [Caudoviricetes sp.]DAM39386.1 MAG TPA: hypothetical protein [Caudoviricetes sp.]
MLPFVSSCTSATLHLLKSATSFLLNHLIHLLHFLQYSPVCVPLSFM